MPSFPVSDWIKRILDHNGLIGTILHTELIMQFSKAMATPSMTSRNA